MRAFDPHAATVVEVDEPSPARFTACLAALELHARQYTGGTFQRGDRVTGRYEAARYLGRQPDGYTWLFGCEADALDARDDFMRIAESAPHCLDIEATPQLYRDTRCAVVVRFTEVA